MVLEYIGEMEHFIWKTSREETNRDTKEKCECAHTAVPELK
jgi:hypothetical protein